MPAIINNSEIKIYWSTAVKALWRKMPKLKGCIAHGDTQDEALREINAVKKNRFNIKSLLAF